MTIHNSTLLLILFTTICLSFSTPLHGQNEDLNQPVSFTLLFDSHSLEKGCFRIPSLITAANGDLIAAIDDRVENCGDLRMNRDINLVIRRSSDNGVTWTDIETVVDYPYGESASDPSMILDRQTGTLWMFFNYMDLENEKDIYYLRAVSSTDHGETWSDPIDITTQISKSGWHDDFKFITSGRGIQTSEGILLHTLVNLDEGAFLFGSEDHGKTWFLIDSPMNPADESKVVELQDGRWMVNSRVANIGMRYIHTTTDAGKNWQSSPDSALTDPGSNASIIRYPSSKDQSMLLFSNSNHPEERKNMTIRVSFDEGDTWTEGMTIYPGSAAYSSMTVLENGDIGIFFEKDDYSQNVFARISLNQLLENP